MSEFLNDFKKFEIENDSKLNFIGGKRLATSTIVVGTESDSNGNSYVDIVSVGTDGSWSGDPICHVADSELGGGPFQIGDEIG